MYFFSSRFGLVMTFVCKGKKFTHPNSGTQLLKAFCKKKKKKSHRDQEYGDIWCSSIKSVNTISFLSAPEIKIFSRTEPDSTGYSPSSWSVILSETRLLLRLQKPLSQDHTAPRISPCTWESRVKKPAWVTMTTQEVKSQRIQDDGPMWSALTEPAWGPLHGKVQLISHFMHTHTYMPTSHI